MSIKNKSSKTHCIVQLFSIQIRGFRRESGGKLMLRIATTNTFAFSAFLSNKKPHSINYEVFYFSEYYLLKTSTRSRNSLPARK